MGTFIWFSKGQVGNKPAGVTEENVVEGPLSSFPSSSSHSVPGSERVSNQAPRVNTLEKHKARLIHLPQPSQDLLEVDRWATLPWYCDLKPWRAMGISIRERPAMLCEFMNLLIQWDSGKYQEPALSLPLTESLLIFSAFRRRQTHTSKTQLITMHILQ